MTNTTTFLEKLSKQTLQSLSKELNIDSNELSKGFELSKNHERCDFTLYLKKLSPEISEIVKENKITKFTTTISNKNTSVNDNIIKEESYTYNLKKVNNELLDITIDKKSLINFMINSILEKNFTVGRLPTNKEDIILLDYSSPNIAKEFHPGHLRTTLLGSFIEKLLFVRGSFPIGINYLGDYGKQFGLIIEGFKRFNININTSNSNNNEITDDVIKKSFEVYVKINALAKEDPEVHECAKENFKKLENKDPEIYNQWKSLRLKSIDKYKILYKQLNIKFDYYSGESFYIDKCKDFLRNLNLKELGVILNFENLTLTKKNEDKIKNFEVNKNNLNLIKSEKESIYVDLESQKLGRMIILRSNGTTLYSTRDMAAILERCSNIHVNKVLYIVGDQQAHYFQQLFETMNLLYDIDKNKLEHISYGMVAGMSTRKGNIVFLQDIINTAKDNMMEILKKDEAKYKLIEYPDATAEEMAISALIVQDFTPRRAKGYTFSMDKYMNTEGETGPYLQYTYCRINSIFLKNYESLGLKKIIREEEKIILGKGNNFNLSGESVDEICRFKPICNETVLENFKSVDFNKIWIEETEGIKKSKNKVNINETIINLISLLLRYDVTLETSLNIREPYKLVGYLMSIAKYINRIFARYKVLDTNLDDDVRKARLAVYEITRYVLGEGMRILGMRPLERV